MSFPVSSRVTGTLITASIWNADLVDNLNALSALSTWTPTIGGSGGQSGQAYAVQVGRYAKVHRLVFASFHIQLSTRGTITGSVQVKGLPFAAENVTNQNGFALIPYFTNFTTSLVDLDGLVTPTSTAITLYALTGAAVGKSALAQADLANTSIVNGFAIYTTAS